MLVSERPGRMRIVDARGVVSAPLGGVPKVQASGEGGLLDVTLDPDFAHNRAIYFAFSEAGATSVARATLNETRLDDVKVIFRQAPGASGSTHWGARLLFLKDSTLLITLGERGRQPDAQDTANTLGKIVRLNRDGSLPADNPDFGPGAAKGLYAIGVRNTQGVALHPDTGEIWASDLGARGGDEINIIRPGRNYGWPRIGYGTQYSGARIGVGAAAPGLEQPLYYWDPSIAPSGIAFYTGDKYPGWKGNLFVSALAGQALIRLELAGERVIAEERLLTGEGERIRQVVQGPDGFLYVLTDSPEGRILRLRPAD